MMKNVLNTDLSGKVAVVTGAGGVLCGDFAKVLARAGASVALLDIADSVLFACLNYKAAVLEVCVAILVVIRINLRLVVSVMVAALISPF